MLPNQMPIVIMPLAPLPQSNEGSANLAMEVRDISDAITDPDLALFQIADGLTALYPGHSYRN